MKRMEPSFQAPDATISSPIAGTSTMAGHIRAYPWSATPIGPIEQWPKMLVLQVNLMLASQHAATLVWGPALVFFYNDAAIINLGPGYLDVLGMPAREAFHEAWHLIGQDVELAYEQGETSIRENLLIPVLKDDALQDNYYTYIWTPIHDQDLRVVGLRGVHHNTTEMMRAVVQLAEVMEATSDAVMRLDRNWTMIYMNTRATELFGPASEILGHNTWEKYPLQIYPGSPYVEFYHRAMDERIAGRFEAYYPEPLNLWMHFEVRPAPDGIIVFTTDLTEKRQAENLIRQAEDRERRTWLNYSGRRQFSWLF